MGECGNQMVTFSTIHVCLQLAVKSTLLSERPVCDWDLCVSPIVILLVWEFARCPVTRTKRHDSVVAAVKENYCASLVKEALSSDNSPLHLLVFPLALCYSFSTAHVCCAQFVL